MIISRTPFRLSFFGGGTDYPAWYKIHGGHVLSTTIDKYCYITLRYLPPFFEHKMQVVYSKIERCMHFEEVEHPAIRETLRFLNIPTGLEIHHDGDLPARSGIGSSSSFTVGLLHALYALRREYIDKKNLSIQSIHIEQNMIKETVGSQDQIAAAYGGMNYIEFKTDGQFEVTRLELPPQRAEEINDHLMLFYTGIKRTASDIADSYVKDINNKTILLKRMEKLVDEGRRIIQSNTDVNELGRLLHETWLLKRNLSPLVSNSFVDDLYKKAMAGGALGGKIAGAGGGGFLLLFVPPDAHERIRKILSHLIYIPFRFESKGSKIIFCDQGDDDLRQEDTDQNFGVLAAVSQLSSGVCLNERKN